MQMEIRQLSSEVKSVQTKVRKGMSVIWNVLIILPAIALFSAVPVCRFLLNYRSFELLS